MHKPDRQLYFILTTVVIFTLLGIRWWPEPAASFAITATQNTAEAAVYHEQFISFSETTAVHAPALSQRDDGKLLAVWYAGTREGAKDVAIASTIIDPDSYTLSPARPIATRPQTTKDTWRYIRKLGNPVIHQLADADFR